MPHRPLAGPPVRGNPFPPARGLAGLAFALAALAAGAAPSLQARRLADGTVLLENAHLRAVFDPRDAGAASSLVQKVTGKELAVCESCGGGHFKAFRESLHVQHMGEALLTLPAGSGATREFTARVGRKGTYVLRAALRTPQGIPLVAERPFDLGETLDVYRAAVPRSKASPFGRCAWGGDPCRGG